MDVDRRQLLAAGVAALTIPGWIAACGRREARGPLAAALAGAAAKGRPLLILHVEDDAARTADLGALVGTFLLYATDEQLAPLAACEITCATSMELRQLEPGAVWRGARAVLVAPGEAPFAAVVGEPPAVEWADWGAQDEERVHEESVHARHAWLARQLAESIAPDLPTLERLAAAEREAAGVTSVDARPQVERARRWPCNALLLAQQDPAQRAAWIEALAYSARGRWGATSPDGSTWAVSAGCGVEYEAPYRDRGFAVSCGMGHTPQISRRFLHLFTTGELGS